MDHAYRQGTGGRPCQRRATMLPSLREMAVLLFAWMYGRLAWLLEDALKRRQETGHLHVPQPTAVVFLEAAADGAAASGTFDGLRDTALGWRADLSKRWPEVQPLALYPAFAG